jgi:hypothetical protein
MGSTESAPLCPRCGQTPEKTAERRADLNGGFFDKPEGSPREMISVYKCRCGTAFTHSSKDDKC